MGALDWVVFKIAQRCNINCTYCYVYNLGDDSWKSRPKFVSKEVVNSLANRITEQCRRYSLDEFNIEFHGGEPLLIGKKEFVSIIETLNESASNYLIKYHLQTNALLLDKEWIGLFKKYQVSFGISLDGPPELADKYRIDHQGFGTTERVVEKINLLSKTPDFIETFGGVLCVLMDPRVNPVNLINWYLNLNILTIDFLFPDGNYFSPPNIDFSSADFGDFLILAFDHWISLGDAGVKIRFFEYIIRGITGEQIGLDSLGGDLSFICVVESDGSIGVSDVGRICPPLAIDKGNIEDTAFDEYSKKYELDKIQKLSSKCLSCKFVGSCKGGYLPHRYDGNSFCNPSFYCDALYMIHEHVLDFVRSQISEVENSV